MTMPVMPKTLTLLIRDEYDFSDRDCQHIANCLVYMSTNMKCSEGMRNMARLRATAMLGKREYDRAAAVMRHEHIK